EGARGRDGTRRQPRGSEETAAAHRVLVVHAQRSDSGWVGRGSGTAPWRPSAPRRRRSGSARPRAREAGRLERGQDRSGRGEERDAPPPLGSLANATITSANVNATLDDRMPSGQADAMPRASFPCTSGAVEKTGPTATCTQDCIRSS